MAQRALPDRPEDSALHKPGAEQSLAAADRRAAEREDDNPQKAGFLTWLLRAVTWWHGATIPTRLWTARKGREVGRDARGNVFYTDLAGRRRWVIYAGESEASRVSPEWHGWLHGTWEAPPTERPVERKSWEKPHLPNLTGTPAAFAPPGSIRRIDPAERSDYEAWSPE